MTFLWSSARKGPASIRIELRREMAAAAFAVACCSGALDPQKARASARVMGRP
jgi:hypothetical protein